MRTIQEVFKLLCDRKLYVAGANYAPYKKGRVGYMCIALEVAERMGVITHKEQLAGVKAICGLSRRYSTQPIKKDAHKTDVLGSLHNVLLQSGVPDSIALHTCQGIFTDWPRRHSIIKKAGGVRREDR